MSFQYSAYFLWRHTISSLLFLIEPVKFNTGSSNISENFTGIVLRVSNGIGAPTHKPANFGC